MAKTDSLVKRVEGVVDLIPTQDALRFFTAILEARNEDLRSRTEIAKVQAAREVALAQIHNKHDLYRRVFDRIFDERRDAISKHFEIIDKGIASGNQELILGGLQGLGQIVATSPFTDLKSLSEVLDGNRKLEF